jgi:hypothetical protein
MASRRILLLYGLLCAPGLCRAAPPVLYADPTHESPVLLLLAGDGLAAADRVVYRALGDPTVAPDHPTNVPSSSNELLGVAELASAVDAPYSLTIHLPRVLRKDQSYALWVVDGAGNWSNAVRINDARPIWLTPAEAYASADPAGLGRRLKIVGRNLNPMPGTRTRVRLTGRAQSYELTAAVHDDGESAVDRYVAEVRLPAVLLPGDYDVTVNRGAAGWVRLLGDGYSPAQVLSVLPDPAPLRRFPVGAYRLDRCDPGSGACSAVQGACAPDASAGGDITRCVVAAIAAARAAGGGAVVFGPGRWSMSRAGAWTAGRAFSDRGVSLDGVLVPVGVSLVGANRGVTTLIRGSDWDLHLPSFALQGNNVVSGFTFRDERVYHKDDSGTALLMLGVRGDRTDLYRRNDPFVVSHVLITENVFDKPFFAVGNDGLGIDHLLVTHNVFGAYRVALAWEGTPSYLQHLYHYSDSVVALNRFYPGSYLDTAIGQGAMATGLSGGYRTDFSENVADGSATEYLYDAAQDAHGWRAAHFWAMNDNLEMMLVSRNVASCTGDKDGDGEAFSYDDNHNRPGFAALTAPVLAAVSPGDDTSSVTVRGALIATQISYGVRIPVGDVTRYYHGDWLQVVQGPGIGQARKIVAITAGADPGGPTVRFVVRPRFDVLPRTDSLVTDSRLFWQAYTVGNLVDHRTPLCLKSNRTRHSGGLITIYLPSVDSVLEGNRQYDTAGIVVAQGFALVDHEVSFPAAKVQSFTTVRDNLLSGAYDGADRTAQALRGINVSYGATPDTAPPPTVSFGLEISHNTVIGAAGPKGAIALNQGWYTGPRSRVFVDSTPWKIAEATTIFKNTLVDAAPRGTLPGAGGPRIGIGLSADQLATPVEWRSVLYGNVCQGALATRGLVDLATQTVSYCPTPLPDSCECQGPAAALVIAATGNPPAAVGSELRYTLEIANHGVEPARGVEVSVEPETGLRVTSIAGEAALCDSEDPGVNLCHLGDLAPGARAMLAVQARVTMAGTTGAVFSVAHRGPQSDAPASSVTLETIALPVR